MSAEQEVQEIIAQEAVAPSGKAKENLKRAHKEVSQLMSSSGIAFFEICAKPETALISDDPKAAFKEFNLISRIYLHAAPGPEDDQILRGTLRAACLSSNLVADWLRCYRQQCHSGVEDWCITKVGSTMRWMRSISLPFYLSPCLRCWTQILWLSANLRSERSSLLLLLLLYQRSLGARR